MSFNKKKSFIDSYYDYLNSNSFKLNRKKKRIPYKNIDSGMFVFDASESKAFGGWKEFLHYLNSKRR